MSALSDLSPDQRAVLQLLLKQGKSYGELAALLRIDPAAVRERAAMALDALAGPAGDGLSDAEVDRLTDFLLGQSETPPPRDAQARAWSETVVDALRKGGLEPKAELGDEPVAEPEAAPGQELPPVPAEAPASLAPASAPAPAPAPQPDPAEKATVPGFGYGPDDEERSSRLGGILLLLGLVAVIAVVLVVVLTRGNGSDSANSPTVAAQTTSADTTTTTPTATSTTPLSVEAQVNMTPPTKGSKALGVATIITDGKTQAAQIQTQGLPANGKSDLYALWLTGGPGGKASLLGFQKTPVGRTGRFQGTASLPADAASYKYIQLSRETQNNPTKPSNVILRGALK